jgi:Cu(I)/Ag(I) efflux system membrane fusion protein
MQELNPQNRGWSATKIRRALAVATVIATMIGLTAYALHSGWFNTGASHAGSTAAGPATANQQGSAQNSAPTGSNAAPKILYWYDPMHPAYKADKPGIAPDCGMALVPQYAKDASSGPQAAGSITLSEGQIALAGVATTQVRREPLEQELNTTAVLVPDETRIAHVHVKTSGYLEQVFANAIGQQVRKGDRLFTLYSPDLVAAEEEYLLARRGNTTLGNAPYREVRDGATALLAAARQKLRLLDVSEPQIAHLEATGEAERELTFHSPVEGFITDRKAFPQTLATPDTDLYTLIDLSTLWANAEVFESELPFIRLGQRMTLSFASEPGRTYSGAIRYIDPAVDAQTRTVKVRIELPNPGLRLKPQMFASATLHIHYGTPLVVPAEAVLNAGNHQQVFVALPGGVFEPRAVTIGPILNGKAIVLSGLQSGDVVASSGNFLLDSESRLKSPSGGGQ